MYIHHMLYFPRTNTVLAAARDSLTGKMYLFMVRREQKNVYLRNALQDIWEAVTDKNEYRSILQLMNKALAGRKALVIICN